MISVRLPDGTERKFKKGTTPLHVAEGIGKKLAKDAVAAKVDGRPVDLNVPLNSDCELSILTFADREGKEVYWHSTSHLMAQAVKQLFPEVKLAIGPTIEEGFYYDFDRKEPFTPEDLKKIEARMEELAKKDMKVERHGKDREAAIRDYQKQAEVYKVELLDELKDEKVSFYRQGEFEDMCRGPHLPSTGRVKAFKLMEVAAAYWRGLSTNPMLQRIYGISFPDKAMLKEHLQRLEEAKKRDHRKLGRELDLFSVNEKVGPGLILYHPKGAIVRNMLENFAREEHFKRGYQPVYIPHIFKSDTWRTSGHYEYYKDSMFFFEIEGQEYGLKPMNCPGHIMIYKSQTRSYRDLPIRFFELGTVYRNEISGVLSGLFRVRGFTQDDAHIYCTPEQLKEEVKGVLKFTQFIMDTFRLKYSLRLSTRPEKAIGTEKEWERATRALNEAAKELGLQFEVEEGEGVFYGPKIDVKMRDAIGREWQGPTVQVDFNLPARFDATYVGSDGKEHAVVMIHRAIYGSIERFFGVLLEHYAGAFPLWLAPVQVSLLPVNDGHVKFAEELAGRMEKAGLRAGVDKSSNTISYKIRGAQMQKVPYMLVIGDKERDSGKLQVRTRRGKMSSEAVDGFIARVAKEVAERV